jgi:hypothetical protein
LRTSEFLHTPAFESGLAVPSTPTAVPLGPAVTTSRRELPAAMLPAGRRPLPLRALAVLVATFSFVLDASDLESSGWGLAREGGILEGKFDRPFKDGDVANASYIEIGAQCASNELKN